MRPDASQSILQPEPLWLVSAKLDRGLGLCPHMLGDICSSEGVAVRHSPLIIENQARHTRIRGNSPTSIDSQATVVPKRPPFPHGWRLVFVAHVPEPLADRC